MKGNAPRQNQQARHQEARHGIGAPRSAGFRVAAVVANLYNPPDEAPQGIQRNSPGRRSLGRAADCTAAAGSRSAGPNSTVLLLQVGVERLVHAGLRRLACGWTASPPGPGGGITAAPIERRPAVEGVLIVSLAGDGGDQSADAFGHEDAAEVRLARDERGIVAADDLDLDLGEELLGACIADRQTARRRRRWSSSTSISSGVTRTIPEA